MREVITVHHGGCGVNIANKFWNSIWEEHGVNIDGTLDPNATDDMIAHHEIHFNELQPGKFKPRAILVDNDPEKIDEVLQSDMGELYDNDKIITNFESADWNYAKGMYVLSYDIEEMYTDQMRKEAETWDWVHGFLHFNGAGGGTGSGTMSNLLSKTRENYPDRIQNMCTVFPMLDLPDNAMELYNTMFTMHHIIENADNVEVFDNQGLYESIFKSQNIESPTMDDFNTSIANTAVDLSAILRFPRENSTDWRGFVTKMVWFPRMHFFMPSCRIMFNSNYDQFVQNLHNPKHLQVSILADFKQVASIYALRGNLRPHKFNQAITNFTKQSSLMKTVDFVPKHIDSTFLDYPSNKSDCNSGTLFSHNLAIGKYFDKYITKIEANNKIKKYWHKFTEYSLDEMEIQEAASNLRDLTYEYDQYNNVTQWDSDYDSDGDES